MDARPAARKNAIAMIFFMVVVGWSRDRFSLDSFGNEPGVAGQKIDATGSVFMKDSGAGRAIHAPKDQRLDLDEVRLVAGDGDCSVGERLDLGARILAPIGPASVAELV